MHYKYTDIKAIVAEILENKKDEAASRTSISWAAAALWVLCTLQRPLWSARA